MSSLDWFFPEAAIDPGLTILCRYAALIMLVVAICVVWDLIAKGKK